MSIDQYFLMINKLNVVISFFIVAFLYFFIFKKYFISVGDPLLIELIACIFSTVVVVNLYSMQLISFFYLKNYLISEVCLIIGLVSIKPININNIRLPKMKSSLRNSSFYLIIYILSSTIYVIVQLYIYLKLGIPLFSGKNGSIYGGMGYLYFLRNINFLVSTYFSILYYTTKFYIKKNICLEIYSYLYTCFVIITLIFSGSKSSILPIIIMYSVFIMYAKKLGININLRKLNTKIFKFLGLGVALFIVIVVLRDRTSIIKGFSHFFMRLLGYGDVYILGYINNTIDRISNKNVFLYLASSNISGFLNNIFKLDIERPYAIGIQIVELLTARNNGFGPNGRYNIFGYIFFGEYGNYLFSYLLGFLISVVRNKMFYVFSHNYLGGLLYFVFYLNTVICITDITTGLTNLFYFVILFFPMMFLSYIVANSLAKSKGQ